MACFTKNSERGVSLYLTVMILTLILAMALGISSLLVSQIRLGRDLGDSVLAFYATETGIERSLFALSEGETGPQWQETLSNNASYIANFENPGEGGCPATVLNYCLKSIGVYNGIRRGIRIAR